MITVKSVQTAVRWVDSPPTGIAQGRFSAGDILIVHDRLINLTPQLGRPKGAVVGTDEGTFTFTSSTRSNFVGSANFPGGSVRVHGRIATNATGTVNMTVIGGTGAYAHARGTVSEPANDSKPANARNTYRLLLP